MKIVFMGTPDFAVESLEQLISAGHQVCTVFSQPDRPKGRGHRLQPTPVKQAAEQAGIPVFQPERLKTDETMDRLRGFDADFFVVVAYGKILPKRILDIPRRGCINVHGSLLPKYRGAAPIQRAVLAGETVSGVTTMFMDEGMDTGDILLQDTTLIGADETSGELFDRLKGMGAGLLVRTLSQLEAGNLQPIAQDETEASMAPMLQKAEACIDWNRSSAEIHNHIRGMNPWPCAYTTLAGKKYKLYLSKPCEASIEAGVIGRADNKMLVGCGIGAVEICELQAENGKRMPGAQYLLGHPNIIGSRFI